MDNAAAQRWDPSRYHQFSDHRSRPALELLGRVPPIEAAYVVDLGCGTGEITRIMAERWPEARVQGLDHSPQMLEKARAGGDDHGDRVEWVEADIDTWAPEIPLDLVYANAALQWVNGHEQLFPRLFDALAPGGVLAVQMPMSRESRSHILMHEVLRGETGHPALGTPELEREMARKWVLDPVDYFDLLGPDAAHLDVWATEYQQVLTGDDPVLEWVSGTGLRPVLNGLPEDERERFLDIYRPALRAEYPRRPDGTTLYPFRRLFIVAVRRA